MKETLLILNLVFSFKLFSAKTLNIKPNELPNKIHIIDFKLKSYTLIQPLVILFGCSIR